MKKNYRVFLPIAIFFYGMSGSQSQDLHFSQYNQTSQLVNPALTGALSVVRATVIYKDQWSSVTAPYKTYGASLEIRFQNNNNKKKGKFLPKSAKSSFRRFAGGISFYNDKAGDGNMGLSVANLSLATFVPVSPNSSLSVGLQASMVQRKIDFNKLIFPDQYSGTGYDASIPNGESATGQNFTYADFAGGINWNYGYSEKQKEADAKIKANIGASIYHIGKPKQPFLGNSDAHLNQKLVFHADFLIGITGTNFSVAPSVIASFQGSTREIIEGAMLKYYFKGGPKYYGKSASSALGAGLTYRNGDALIVSGQVEFGQYAIGVSYDLNSSVLSKVSKVRGGPEVFLRFVTPDPFLKDSKPKRRYNL